MTKKLILLLPNLVFVIMISYSNYMDDCFSKFYIVLFLLLLLVIIKLISCCIAGIYVHIYVL